MLLDARVLMDTRYLSVFLVDKCLYIIEVGNTHEMLGPQNHSWSFFVRGQNGSSLVGAVDKVFLRLHESFPEPDVTLEKQPFVLKGKAWGTFNIKLRIHMVDGRSFNLDHLLSFAGRCVYSGYEVSATAVTKVY